ncbi:MAG: sigma-70 family RNA polymerase sigma factor [Desulfobacterales bacterium]
MIHKIAAIYHKKYPAMDYWHFVSAGWIGYRAAQRLYDPDRRSSFKTFARLKIKLAMRQAVWDEIEYFRVKNHRKIVIKSHFGDIIDKNGNDPLEFDRRERIQRTIDKLKPRYADIVRRYYYGDNTHSEIGRRYGVTEHRISQIKKAAVKKMAASIKRQESPW